MPQPPSESGNVVDPDVLAARRARRAEVSEDATLELRLFEAERRLGEAAAERDELRAQVATLERDVRGTRQREWAEQQQRLEAQGEAAATRELAGAQLATLRERLTKAEAELAVVAAERDRARRALEDEQLRATAERERREALEREGLLLRAELARRDGLAGAAAQAVAEARRSLAASAPAEGLEARIARERQDFAERVVALERAVASVRERLGTAARSLRAKLEVERTARRAAESALGAERTARVAADRSLAEVGRDLEASRARLAELERERAGLETALGAERVRTVALEGELAAERERAVALEAERTRLAERGDAGRVAALEGELARRDVVEVQLRSALEAVSAELAAVRAGDDERIARLAERVESVVALASGRDELASSLAAMRERVAELQDGLSASADLSEQLEAERAARWVAEAELDAERRRGDEDRSRLADAESELTELRALARPPGGPDPAALASLRAALDGLKAATPTGDTPSPSLTADLAAAAARLRGSSEEVEPEVVVEPEVESEVEVAPEVEVEPEVEVVEPELEVAAEPEPELAVAAEPVRQPLPARAPVGPIGPWLRDALVGLAADEPDIAELVLDALLPLQAELVDGPLSYELVIGAGATRRVVIEGDHAHVELPGKGAGDARITGPLAALVPLATGGAGWRLPGTRIEHRRRVRRLLKARRAPLGMAELAVPGLALSPGLLLTLLTRAVRPEWTQDRALIVDIAPQDADRWRLIATGQGPLAILPAEGAPPAPATLHVAAGKLAAVLAGTAATADAHVTGNVGDVRTLLSWLDRAQRGAR